MHHIQFWRRTVVFQTLLHFILVTTVKGWHTGILSQRIEQTRNEIQFLYNKCLSSSSSSSSTRRIKFLSSNVRFSPSPLSTSCFSLSLSESLEQDVESLQQDYEQHSIVPDGLYTREEVTDLFKLGKLCVEAGDDKSTLRKVVLDAIPRMSPTLIMKIRRGDGIGTEIPPSLGAEQVAKQQEIQKFVTIVATSMNGVIMEQLDEAKETLLQLLNAGEIRKLDGLIGAAARQGKLDAAFFNVLSANILEASTTSTSASLAQPQTVSATVSAEGADRTSILRHIYTRCQEEVEKTMQPGTAFLNKLLRTNQQSIRFNLYKHYLLTPDNNTSITSSDSNDHDDASTGATVITTPDGKQVRLKMASSVQPLIDINEFVRAIEQAVLQIRTLERSGAVDRAGAAQMVEACRIIAKETRIVLGERYGPDSTQFLAFQDQLQPVFRPDSPDSPYIRGFEATSQVQT